MPLRDHFRPPVSKRASWEGFHGLWPGMIVQKLVAQLPSGYVAEPRVHLGSFYEIDICAFEGTEPVAALDNAEGNGSIAAATLAPPAPSVAVETEFPEEYAYEVLIFDVERDRRLVAAVEIVSPANKDRPVSRQLFVAKCANLLQKDVCVSIVDLVTIRSFNLYVDLLGLMRRQDPAFGREGPPTYAATCRKRTVNGKTRLETWSFPVAIGQPLPKIPLWLTEDLHISLDLEPSYEETCRVLRIA
jgi:Protein of unknown function (DUF4058)